MEVCIPPAVLSKSRRQLFSWAVRVEWMLGLKLGNKRKEV